MSRWSVVVVLGAFLGLPGLASGARTDVVTVGPLAEGHDFATIAEAADAARPEASTIAEIVVSRRAAPYAENFTLVPGVRIRGEETAFTTLTGEIRGDENGTLRNFTIKGTVDLSRIQQATIENNIFTPAAATTTSIIVDTTPPNLDPPPAGEIFILHNTFHRTRINGTAVELTAPQGVVTIQRNIFVGFATGISVVSAAVASNVRINENVFFNNTTDLNSGTLDTSNLKEDPLFIAPERDPGFFRLKENTRACHAGAFASESNFSDGTPTPITPAWRLVGNAVEVFWSANDVCNPGPITSRVFMRTPPAASPDAAPVFGPQVAASFVVTEANVPPRAEQAPPAPPQNVSLSPRDGALLVRWTKVTADGYRVRWRPQGGAESTQDVGDVAEFTIEGLVNGTTYEVAVTSYFSDFRFFTVTARSSLPVGVESRPGSEVRVPVRPLAETAPSFDAGERPEEIMTVPDLQNNGACFVGSLASTGNASRPLLALAALCALGAAALRSRAIRGASLAVALLGSILLGSPAEAREPRWVVGLMAGAAWPATEDWGANFDKKWVPAGKLNLGLRLLRWVEVGAEGGFWRAKGEATTTVTGRPLGVPLDQTLEVIPLNAYALLNFQFFDRQWLVPYAGGGYSRYYYRQALEGTEDVRGHLDGYHFRGGLKFLLNSLDPTSARRANAYFSLQRTFIALEAQFAKIDDFGDSEADLGGRSYYGGLVLEF